MAVNAAAIFDSMQSKCGGTMYGLVLFLLHPTVSVDGRGPRRRRTSDMLLSLSLSS